MSKPGSGWSVALLVTCFSLAYPASGAHLVRDVNDTYVSASGSIGSSAELSGVVLVAIDDGVSGMELWASDGSAAGTRLVRDINPGASSSDPLSFTVLNGIAYFWADDGTNGRELWRSDATAAGTFIVVDIRPGPEGFGGPITHGRPVKTHEGILYFTADDGQTGLELWRSDGSPTGTYRLADINPGPAAAEPTDLTTVGAHIFFSADDGTRGRELWRTDGTVTGTRMIRDVAPGPLSGVPGLFRVAVVNDTLLFGADDGTHGFEPWRATADQASMVVDLNTYPHVLPQVGTLGSGPNGFIRTADRVIFRATITVQDGLSVRHETSWYSMGVTGVPTTLPAMPLFEQPSELTRFDDRTIIHFSPSGGGAVPLWVSDGTAAGTAPLRSGGKPLFRALTTLEVQRTADEAFFFASIVEPGGTEVGIWRSDGTDAGTREFANVAQPFIATELVRLGERLYFRAGRFSDGAGDELWVSDGTPAGTQRVADIRPGPEGSQILGMFGALGRIFMQANDGLTGGELWTSDGTSGGTFSLGDLNTTVRTGSSEPDPQVAFGSGVVFVADDGRSGREPWFSDGTFAGTRLIADIAPGLATSAPSFFTRVGNFLLFVADDGASGRELWRTDGTLGGTSLVADIAPGIASGDPIMTSFGAVVMNGVAYFSANDNVNGTELWRSDGTTAGTFMVADLTPGSGGAQAIPFGVAGSRVVFRYLDRLWASDGTPGGTAQLHADLVVMTSVGAATLDGRVYFAGQDGQGDVELWRSDGTAAGTQPVTDTANGSLFFDILETAGARLVFNGCISGQGCGLYGSDGTNAGTAKIANLSPGTSTSDGTRLFFVDSTTLPSRIFVTDGTAAGTRPFVPAQVDLRGGALAVAWFSGVLVFTVEDTVLGPVIWRSDGSVGGTRLFADLDPGVSADRPPVGYLVAGSRLFFAASHVTTGNELHVIEGDLPHANPDAARAGFNTTMRIAVLENDAAFSGTLDRSSVEVVVAPRFASAVVDITTGEIVYAPNVGFSGSDTLEYRVSDDQGRRTNTAVVTITVAAVSGSGPGTAPVPPPQPPPPQPPAPPAPPSTPGTSGGGGGGGSFTWIFLLLLLTHPAVCRSERAADRARIAVAIGRAGRARLRRRSGSRPS